MDQGIADKIELLCHIRKTPNVLMGMFLELTRQFYSETNNLPIDTCAHWDPDPRVSTLWIDSEYEWDEDTVEQRPAIFVKLGNITYSSLTGRKDGRMGMCLEEGEYRYTRNGEGTVSWVHIGSTRTEAAVLAGTTLDYVDAFGAVIRDDLKFESFALQSVSPMAIDKESKERYRSIVTVAFTFQDTWTLKLESPKLKKVIYRTGQGLVLNGIL